MDKKYFTGKLFIVSGILLIVCGIIFFCYPFFMPEFDQLLFKMIFWSLGFVSLGGGNFTCTLLTDAGQQEEL